MLECLNGRMGRSATTDKGQGEVGELRLLAEEKDGFCQTQDVFASGELSDIDDVVTGAGGMGDVVEIVVVDAVGHEDDATFQRFGDGTYGGVAKKIVTQAVVDEDDFFGAEEYFAS